MRELPLLGNVKRFLGAGVKHEPSFGNVCLLLQSAFRSTLLGFFVVDFVSEEEQYMTVSQVWKAFIVCNTHTSYIS